MRKDLIDAVAEHDVAAQQDSHHMRVIDYAEHPPRSSLETDKPRIEEYKDLPEG